jgi:WD40 repeat protein
MVLFGQFADPDTLERFQVEARTGAKLKHPNIVAIHDLGTLDGRPWFTMDLIDGPNLGDAFRSGLPTPREAAQLLLTIVEAITYAHGQGVLHRDLKPSNILLDSAGHPHVTDFGLARLIADDSTLTRTGQALGSPNYMAPEQAAGTRETGAAGDIWSLGAILHFLLTGRPPFAGASVADTLRAVREDEPVLPRRLNGLIPADFETICLKCLEKEPTQRYSTAKALDEDLARFLRDEPILAQPIGPVGRLWRWCRRKPAIAALVLALNLAFALGLAGVLWQWRRAQLNATEEARERHRAEAGELSAQLNQYVSDMNLVQQAWEGGNVNRAQALLRTHIPKPGQPDFRGFEWRYLWKLCKDQSRFTFTNLPGLISLAVSPAGKFAATTSDDVIRLLDFVNGIELGTLIQSGVTHLAFSPNAPNILATGSADGTVTLWDLGTRRAFASLRSETGSTTTGVAFSPDGTLLASTAGQTVTLWNVQNRTRLWTRPTPEDTAAPSFAPDGRSLVTAGGENMSLMAWDLATTNSWTFPAEQTGDIAVTAFSPDGKLLVTGGQDGRTILWDYFSRTVVGRLVGHHGPCLAAQFSPDGRYLASGGEDSTLRLWDVPSRSQVAVLRGHQAGLVSVAFTPDGRSVLSSSSDHTIKVWDTEPKPAAVVLQGPTTWVNYPYFSPDGTQLISVHIRESFTRFWDVISQRSIAELSGPSRPRSAAFSPNGAELAIGGRDRTVWLWSPKTLQLHHVLTNHFVVGSLSISADRGVLAGAAEAWG